MKLQVIFGVATLTSLFGLAGCVAADSPPETVTYADVPPPPPPAEAVATPLPAETTYVPPGTYASAPTYAADDDESDQVTGTDEGEIQVETVQDFDQPLQPYGEWVIVGSYGRCWRPSHVNSDWRPYCNGHWIRTDRGWYWQSDEAWGWATYHYGRWDQRPGFGWVWIPQTHWAPAWVAWRSGGGYVGWAPLPPTVRFSGGHEIHADAPDRAFVFVQEGRFNDRVRTNTVVINNTTVIRQTVNITNISVTNNRIHNEGPRVQEIEKATGQPVKPVQAVQLRHQIEHPIVVSHPTFAHQHPVRVQTPASPRLQTQGAAVVQPNLKTPPTPVYHSSLNPHPTTLPLNHTNVETHLHPSPTLKPLDTRPGLVARPTLVPTHQARPIERVPEEHSLVVTQTPHVITTQHPEIIQATPRLRPTLPPQPLIRTEGVSRVVQPTNEHHASTVSAPGANPPAVNPPVVHPKPVVHPPPPPEKIKNPDQTPPSQSVRANQGN